jgi:1-aminocyclopropane-1-carboxylate deaminase/D-cysteine desulfhydrase-like pyridoxal-dependent ACC family enzyme
MCSGNADRRTMISSTPIEQHRLGRRRVFVKRDDLCSRPPAPPLGKLRGLEPLISRLVALGATTIGCWDTRVSKLGQGLAALARDFDGITSVVCYPQLKNGTIPEPVKQAEQLRAVIVPMRGNHVSICFTQATRIVNQRGGVMIPFGMDCTESVVAIAAEARRVPAAILRNGTVVVSCGSGVTLAGLLQGFDPAPRRVVGVSSGRSLARLRQCLHKYLNNVPSNVTLIPASQPYESVPILDCPFPAHPNYDLKAWKYLVDHLESLTPPLLFWNIGA